MPSRFRNPMNMPGAQTASGAYRNLNNTARGFIKQPIKKPAPPKSSGGGGSTVRRAPARAPARRAAPARPKPPDFTAQARKEAARQLQLQMKVIDHAIKAAQSQAKTQRKDFTARGKAAKGELADIYGMLIDQTQGMNQGINETYAQAAGAAEQGGQSLIDTITGRNQEAVSGVEDTLGAAGIKGVGTEGLSDNLAVGEMIAGNMANTINQNYGMMGAAQEAMGEWNVQGAQHDKSRRKDDVNSAVMDMIAQLEEQLAAYLQQQEGERLGIEAQRPGLERQIASQMLSDWMARNAGGGGGGGGGGGFSGGVRAGGGGSFNPSVNSRGLPSDAVPVDLNMLKYTTPDPAPRPNPNKLGGVGAKPQQSTIGTLGRLLQTAINLPGR